MPRNLHKLWQIRSSNNHPESVKPGALTPTWTSFIHLHPPILRHPPSPSHRAPGGPGAVGMALRRERPRLRWRDAVASGSETGWRGAGESVGLPGGDPMGRLGGHGDGGPRWMLGVWWWWSCHLVTLSGHSGVVDGEWLVCNNGYYEWRVHVWLVDMVHDHGEWAITAI